MHVRYAALLYVIATLLPLHAHACDEGQRVTGLDPTQVVTSASLESTRRTLTPHATQAVQSLRATYAPNGTTQFGVTLPFHESLNITGAGSAHGVGDSGADYTRVLSCGPRWRTAALLGATFNTGNVNFTAGGVQLAPAAAVSYSAVNWLRLVAVPRYSFPIAQQGAFARTQTLGLTARAIATLPAGGYAAADLEPQHVSGAYRYNAATASFTLGGIIARHYNLAAFYQLPITQFTHDHIEYSAFGVRLTFQR